MRAELVIGIALLSAVAQPLHALNPFVTRDCCLNHDENPHSDGPAALDSDFRVVIGFRTGLTMPGGGAARLWKRAGAFRMAEGLRLGLGYDYRNIGILFLAEGGGSGLKASDALIGLESSHLTASLMLNWRPGVNLWHEFRPRLGIGYLHERIGTAHFRAGQFPVDALDPSAITSDAAAILHYPNYIITDVTTDGDGFRLSAGIERPVWGHHLDIFAEGAVDLLSFGRVNMLQTGPLSLDHGWSVIPALSLGIAWRPF